ncbi:MAG TPA: hypothetical protein VFQ35_04595 [Polyangiaceae bacterium]|nr:hypothetical protein [Polyangiaceae bacterium]
MLARSLVQTAFATLALQAVACHEKSATSSATPSAKPLIPSTAAPSAAPRTSAPAAAPLEAKTNPAPPAGSATPVAPGTGPFVIDEAFDVGPAGPAAAHESGVVLVDKLGHVALAKRGPLPTGSVASKGSFSAVDRPRDEFLPYARGPALVGGFAYWIKDEKLVRARVTGNDADPEEIASDARKGARVSGAEMPDGTPVVAFITKPDSSGAPHAKVWFRGKVFDLTPEGAGASSVALVRSGPRIMAISLDGRSGMTPLHARLLSVEQSGALALGPDVVAWVGASAQATTEVFATAAEGDVWAFVPIEQDLTHFGLAQIHLGSEPRLDAKVTFLTYQAGTNSAPVAAGIACGRSAVAFAEPEEAAPKSPQRLVVAAVGAEGLEPGEVVARGRSFANVSLGAAGPGALLVYTADHRTWARSVRCRDRARPHSELPGALEKR